MAQSFTFGTVALIAALTGAGGFALGRFTGEPPSTSTSTSAPQAPQVAVADSPTRPQQAPPSDLPPNHPPVDPNNVPPPMAPQAADGPRPLQWTKPTAWSEAPNTSSMRIATYKAPIAPGDKAAPELTVMQAGGSLDANIDRWAGQFGEEGKLSLKREKKTLAGYPVTIVSTHGQYGGMSGEAKANEPYELLAAIVETPELPFFFKMTGPLKSVEAARKDFDALLASFKKP